MPIVNSADFVIANLESCWDGDGRLTPIGEKTHIATTLATANLLKELGISAVSTANNHSFDYGVEGWQKLKTACESNQIQVFGGGDPSVARKPAIVEKNGVSVALLGYADPDCGAIFADNEQNGAAKFSLENASEDIKKAKQNGHRVVVNIHWGEERIFLPSPRLRNWARELEAAGADLIIGHHPHVLQGAERINNTWVFYSLGNFFMGNIIDGGVLKTKYISPNFVNAAPLFEFSSSGIELVNVFGMRNTSQQFRTIPADKFNRLWNRRCMTFNSDDYDKEFFRHQDLMWRYYIPVRYRLMCEPFALLKRLNITRLKRLLGLGRSPWKNDSDAV